MKNSVQDNTRKFKCRDYHVLVVDNVDLNRGVAAAMLGAYGIEVDEADGGRAAIAMAKEYKYDIIFMDHMMPEVDGVEAARTISEHFGGSAEAPRIIALTANPAQEFRELYAENGICDVLSKPVEPVQLYDILDKWVPGDRKQYVEQEEKAPIPEEDLLRLSMRDINAAAAVKIQGSIDAYLDLLDLFYADGLRRKEMLKGLIDRQDITNYVIEVHGLKSAAANIGADGLSDLAKQHEESGKTSGFAYIKENAGVLFDAYESVLQEIACVLEQHKKGQFSVGTGDRPAQIEEKELSGGSDKETETGVVRKRVLAVDDNAVNLSAIETALQDQYEVVPMIAAKRALKYLGCEKVDLILLDVKMPEMDGVETLEKMRKLENGKDVPVIFLTATKDDDVAGQGAGLGIRDYIIKPFDREDMRKRIAQLLE